MALFPTDAKDGEITEYNDLKCKLKIAGFI